jgi:LPS O-antigen subunit length determinant protein (WzzB/FepE family)
MDNAAVGKDEYVATHQGLSLRELVTVVFQKFWQILIVVFVFLVAGGVYAYWAPEWYRAEIVLAPSQDSGSASGLLGQLGGLASIAGLSVGSKSPEEPLAILRSRDLARDFVLQHGLADLLKSRAGSSRQSVELEDAVIFFMKNIRGIYDDKRSGYVTVSMEWTDRTVVAPWATDFVRLLNQKTRDRALREAEKNIAYLRQEVSSTGVISLQQALSRLLESELQKQMLAKGNDEYSFRVIDSAVSPKSRIRPKRLYITFVSGLVGGVFAVFFFWVRSSFRRPPKAQNQLNGVT